MIPFIADKNDFNVGEYVYIKGIKQAIISGADKISAEVIGENKRKITLKIGDLTPTEKEIIIKGCLINYYRSEK